MSNTPNKPDDTERGPDEVEDDQDSEQVEWPEPGPDPEQEPSHPLAEEPEDDDTQES
jgi:hypothetical protein